MRETDTQGLLDVVATVWADGGVSLQGDYARRNSALIAMASSLQLITTRVNKTEFGHKWRITSKGLRWLNENKEDN